ncbi:uncharacterized protein N7496_010264 [Penicillium cataractarum]|uniref:Uncharacterized protein n=1 Tax=Penicillium cataractarum TaxID=2100454 RepID=A0A9W9RQZ2_9EURO|nr:uncharacterized protein N7496_010264 [Penicillium cataractarum]KAJ5364551.1 hypothetical protein N7496_010264 [Penicillium cataractarum]
MVVSASAWNVGPGGRSSDQTHDAFGDVVEAILAAMGTNGLTNVSPWAMVQGSVTPGQYCAPAWVKALMPQGPGALGKGGILWNMSGVDTTNMTKFTTTATANGYAYASSRSTTITAIIVLLIYCVMVVPHTIYTFWTGWSSSSWDSIPEIVALAMQSTPTEILENTGAGISTTRVFSEPVQVWDMGQRLELTFRDTRNGGIEIKENETYR